MRQCTLAPQSGHSAYVGTSPALVAIRSSTLSILPSNCCTSSGVLNAVKQFNGLGIVDHDGNCPVEGLRAKQGLNTCSEGEFESGALETDEVEREIVDLRLGLTFLVVGEGVDTVEHGGLFCEDLGILDAVLRAAA